MRDDRLMKVSVQFYAQLRDIFGKSKVDFDLSDGSAVSDLLEAIYQRCPDLRVHDRNILTGAGVEFVDRNYKLKVGEEIAIMPPVQGG
jgi:MoaD family protein